MLELYERDLLNGRGWVRTNDPLACEARRPRGMQDAQKPLVERNPLGPEASDAPVDTGAEAPSTCGNGAWGRRAVEDRPLSRRLS
jgi:hypothetical protein